MSLSLDEAARLAGGHFWSESRLFEIVGAWVQSTPESEAKLLLDRHSQHHAWRADQWWDRLPILAETDRESLVEAPSRLAATVAGRLAESQGTVCRLAGLYRVALPRRAAAYQLHLSLTSPATDGATIRTLNLLSGDVGADWREGELLLQQLLVDEGSVQAATETVAGLELLLAQRKTRT